MGDRNGNRPGDDGATVRPETDRLLLDVMLGKLAVYLRLCGFDTAYAGDRGIEADDRIAATANREGRRLCTRDVELAGRVPGSILLFERETEAQLAELRDRGVVLEVADSPTYCGRCNGELESVESTAKTPEYAPDPEDIECWRCRACEQVFWKGSHHERMAETIESV